MTERLVCFCVRPELAETRNDLTGRCRMLVSAERTWHIWTVGGLNKDSLTDEARTITAHSLGPRRKTG
jgi:hypothetical protein